VIELKIKLTLLIVITFSLVACSSAEKTVKEKKTDETYVFDEVPPEDYYTFETPIEKNDAVYIVQIGAFSTLDRAKQFADKSRLQLQKDIKVNFNDRNNLYVVQIHPPFQSKSDAVKYRDELWKNDYYNDAWILEVNNQEQ
jgi:cell division septation protein DedD